MYFTHSNIFRPVNLFCHFLFLLTAIAILSEQSTDSYHARAALFYIITIQIKILVTIIEIDSIRYQKIGIYFVLYCSYRVLWANFELVIYCTLGCKSKRMLLKTWSNKNEKKRSDLGFFLRHVSIYCIDIASDRFCRPFSVVR